MNITTHSCQDGCRFTAPRFSPASTPELLGEAPEPSLPPISGVSAPPVLLSQTSPKEDGMEDDLELEPTLLYVLKVIKVNHCDLMGKVEELKLDIIIMCQDMLKIREHVSATERRISDLGDTINPLLP